MRKSSLLATLLMLTVTVAAEAQSNKTVVKDQKAKQMLLGQHRLSLQWISWDYFGKAIVAEANGRLTIKGEQRGRGNDDFLKIDGRITLVDTKEITFNGTIITRVSHINGGKECKREGEMTFRITGTRRYWRLKEMDNPCEAVTDYVDIYFR